MELWSRIIASELYPNRWYLFRENSVEIEINFNDGLRDSNNNIIRKSLFRNVEMDLLKEMMIW